MLAGAATVAGALLAVDVIGALTGGESVDRTTYIVALGVLAPGGGLAAVRLLRWGGTAGDAGRGWAVLAGLGVLAAVAARRLAGNAEPTEAGAIAVTLLCLVAVLLALRLAGRDPGRLARLGRAAWRAEALIAAQLAVVLLLFSSTLSLDAWLRATAVAVVLAGLLRLGRRSAQRGLTRALDVAGLAVLGLALTDLSVVAEPDLFALFGQFHHNFFLAPVSDVLAGKALLIDTFPQYGPGLTAALAGAFSLIPLGYGTFGLLTVALTVLQYGALYALLRVGGVRPVLASAGVLGIVALCLYSTFGPPSLMLPSTVGPRHLPGYFVALASVLATAGFPHAARWRLAALAGLAVAAAWSAEALAFSGAAWLGVAAARCIGLEAGRGGLRALGREAVVGALAALAGLAALSAGVLAWTGEIPAWDRYVEYLRAYNAWPLFASPAQPWSPLVLVGAAYVLSFVGLCAALGPARRCPRRRIAVSAIAGLTALGAVTMSYAVSRSDDFALLSVATPALALVFVWAGLLLDLAPERPKLAASLAAAFVPALLLGAGWDGLRAGLPSTAPGIVVSDGPGRLGDVLGAAWDFPPVAPHAREAERLLRRLPGRRAAVLLTPDAQVEALLRARTANALAITHPVSESVFGQIALDRLEPSIRGMAACTPLITQIDLGSAVLASPITPGLAVPALEQVGDAFRLEQVRVRRSGLVTSRLVPARAGPRFSCPPLPR